MFKSLRLEWPNNRNIDYVEKHVFLKFLMTTLSLKDHTNSVLEVTEDTAHNLMSIFFTCWRLSVNNNLLSMRSEHKEIDYLIQ